MTTYSPSPADVKPDIFNEMPAASSSRHARQPSAGPSSGGITWTKDGPMLKMENAVVETVVTHTTRTTTSFAPIPLPRIPMPESIPKPDYLAPELYPLATVPAPPDARVFALNLGGQKVIVHDDNTIHQDSEPVGPASGPGWTRTYPALADLQADTAERLNLVQALGRGKGKEVRKRPHDFARATPRAAIVPASEVPTPPITVETAARPRRSPPRKKIRGLDELNIPADASNALLSPLPSPEQEAGPSLTSNITGQQHTTAPPSIGTGVEMATLFSLPAMVSHFEGLPDKLQQQVLMHMLRRSRMPTIQRAHAFAGMALKRDFISHLPHEIAVQILKKVDTPSLANAMRVSKKWRKMIDGERSVWRQRLIDDDLWCGLGVETEAETVVTRRMDILEWKQQREQGRRPVKAGTPIDDEPMHSAPPVNSAPERPVPLKHVYRKRYTDTRNWLNTRPEHTTFAGHGTNVVTCLQFDEDKIISASDDHSINVYNTFNGALRKRLDGHEGGVWALQYKGDTLVSGSTDRTVRIWDLESLTEAHVFHGHTSTVRCLQIIEPVLDEATGEFFPAYPMLVTGSRDTTLRVWKLPRKGEPPMPPQIDEEGVECQIPPEQNPWHVHLLEGHSQAVRALAAHGRVCISGSYDMTVKVWDLVTGVCKYTLVGHEQKVYSVAYDRYRNRCASGSMDNSVKVWNVANGECLHTLVGHTSLVGLLGISANFLVSAAADGSLRVWDSNDHELKHTLNSHGGAITCFQHDETKVVSGSDGTLKLWDLRSGQYVRDLVIGISSVWQVAFHNNLLVAASNRGGSTVFDVFDFGAESHTSPIDDESLDRLCRPAWESANPLEPREYQDVNDIDGVQMTSPTDLMNLASPTVSDRYRRDSSALQYQMPGSTESGGSGSRRSNRLAAKHPGTGTSYSLEPPPRVKKGMSVNEMMRFLEASKAAARASETSPSPAGPSRLPYGLLGGAGSISDSFAPMFDEDEEEQMVDREDYYMDEDVKEEPF